MIIFLVWLWLTNVAILLGAEFDAELGPGPRDRRRPAAAAEPYIPLRDVPRREAPVRTAELSAPAPAELPAVPAEFTAAPAELTAAAPVSPAVEPSGTDGATAR